MSTSRGPKYPTTAPETPTCSPTPPAGRSSMMSPPPSPCRSPGHASTMSTSSCTASTGGAATAKPSPTSSSTISPPSWGSGRRRSPKASSSLTPPYGNASGTAGSTTTTSCATCCVGPGATNGCGHRRWRSTPAVDGRRSTTEDRGLQGLCDPLPTDGIRSPGQQTDGGDRCLGWHIDPLLPDAADFRREELVDGVALLALRGDHGRSTAGDRLFFLFEMPAGLGLARRAQAVGVQSVDEDGAGIAQGSFLAEQEEQ